MTSRQLIENRRNERRVLAAELRELRAMPGLSRRFRYGYARKLAKGVPANPTRANLLAESRALLSWEPRYGSRDTEYYSACGYDDYLSERHHEARQLGFLLRYAARLVD